MDQFYTIKIIIQYLSILNVFIYCLQQFGQSLTILKNVIIINKMINKRKYFFLMQQ